MPLPQSSRRSAGDRQRRQRVRRVLPSQPGCCHGRRSPSCSASRGGGGRRCAPRSRRRNVGNFGQGFKLSANCARRRHRCRHRAVAPSVRRSLDKGHCWGRVEMRCLRRAAAGRVEGSVVQGVPRGIVHAVQRSADSATAKRSPSRRSSGSRSSSENRGRERGALQRPLLWDRRRRGRRASHTGRAPRQPSLIAMVAEDLAPTRRGLLVSRLAPTSAHCAGASAVVQLALVAPTGWRWRSGARCSRRALGSCSSPHSACC